jgi:lipid II:glycine glycyltransferase (peptidoglycan interpeptide bridge formation enzyme)
MTEVIAVLPRFALFHQWFHWRITNWLPFSWKGFQQTTLYTYRIEETSDLTKLWSETRDNVRTDIKKAEKTLEVVESNDFEHVIRMQKMTLGRQGKILSFSDEFLRAFGAACASHGASKIFLARDNGNRVHACVYLLWDNKTVYYYTGGGDPELRNSGAASLLVWKAIEFASMEGKQFDFEGSTLEPIERFFRSFGPIQTPFFQIRKTNSHMALAAKKILGWWKA